MSLCLNRLGKLLEILDNQTDIINNDCIIGLNDLVKSYGRTITTFSNMYITKEDYNKHVNKIENLMSEHWESFQLCIHKTDEIVGNLEKLKQTLLANKETIEKFEPLHNELLKVINKKYLETGSKMSKLALNALPKSDEELDKSIMNSLNKLNLNEDEKSNARDFYMNAVDVERKAVGGKKRKTNRKRTRKNKKY